MIQFIRMLAGALLIASMAACGGGGGSAGTTATGTGTGTGTVNFNHTTTATANRLLLVGVSINLTNSNGAAVTGVTYNGTALNFVGAHNDAGNTRRVEVWSRLNPVAGANLPIVVTVNVPTAGATVGVRAALRQCLREARRFGWQLLLVGSGFWLEAAVCTERFVVDVAYH